MKTAIITGGSRGIGFAITQKLSDLGYNVAVLATRDFAEYKEKFQSLKGDYLYFKGDVSSSDDRKNLVKAVVEKFGEINVLVNNAGVAPKQRADLLDMSEESFDRVLSINTKSYMFMSQLVANQMIKQEMNGKKRGTIINVSSCSAVVSSTNRGEYCVSKAGIAMLTTLFADRLASESIYVHEIRPGVIATDMTSGVQEKYDNLIENGAFPIARWGTPEDIANAVAVFSGDDFLYTTGNFIDVDGGFHIKKL